MQNDCDRSSTYVKGLIVRENKIRERQDRPTERGFGNSEQVFDFLRSSPGMHVELNLPGKDQFVLRGRYIYWITANTERKITIFISLKMKHFY